MIGVVQVDVSSRRSRCDDRFAIGQKVPGFATAPLVVAGCIMMQVCMDILVGVATKNHSTGTVTEGGLLRPSFMFLRREVQEYLAQLGFRTL